MNVSTADERRLSARDPVVRWAGTAGGKTTLAALFLLGLTLAVFGKVLFGPGDVVLSNIDTDLAKQFVHWRGFGFRELRAGHLALWNPHIFSGTPYFGGFQSALLYPPNWLYLCLPLARAINVGIALHVFLAGMFMFFWTCHRGLHPLACALAAVLFMFCGPYFPHIYAGHLPNLCTMVWAPLLFLAIDGWLERRTAGWLLLGAGAVAMQILAGHPQYVFYTGLAAAFYCMLHLGSASRRVQAAAGLGAMVAGAVGLSAIQLFEGFHAAGESLRSLGTSMPFAAEFSFPPENFLTALVPGFFGDMTNYQYWGRCYLWEMSLFFGISGLVLAVYGAFQGERQKRRYCALIALVLFLPALGGHTPLFPLLYHYAPGFNKFRGWSKFTFPAVLFLIMLAAVGFDRMLRGGPAGRCLAWSVFAAGILLLGAAGLTYASLAGDASTGPRPWVHWMHRLIGTGEQLVEVDKIRSAVFIRGAARFAGFQLLSSAGTMLALGTVFLAARRWPRALTAVLLIATAEMLVFARSSLDTFPLDDALDTPAARFLSSRAPGDYRVLNRENANLAMSIGARDLWGYDPGVLRRYAEWMAATQGVDADSANTALVFNRIPSLYATLLRGRYVLNPATDGRGTETAAVSGMESSDEASRLRLISQVRLLRDRDRVLDAMQDPAFDPANTVILESPPDPAPVSGGRSGTVAVVAETSDSLTIEADLAQAAVMLITDTYCSGWQAHSLLPAGQAVQAGYTVSPADYCLRAIPLAAGHHRLLLEYRPRAFVIGKWTTLASLGAYLGLVAYCARRHRTRACDAR